MQHESFIGQYKIEDSVCDNLIEEFKKRKDEHNTDYHPHKKSTDLCMQPNDPALEIYATELQKCITAYEKFYNLELNKFGITNHYNDTCVIQYYKPGEGFPALHYERASMSSLKRELVYMLYCNTLKNGGTHFPNQNKTLKAVKGKLYIWPAGFTHPHQGVICKTKEKYIVTGWFENCEK